MKYQKLNVGAGPNPVADEGWLNLDRIAYPGVQLVADIREVGFAAGTFSHIRAYEFIEHFFWPEIRVLLRSFHDWLRSGGMLEIKCPDVEELARRYLSDDDPDTIEEFIGRIYGSHGDHRWGFSPAMLESYLTDAGFTKVAITSNTAVRDLHAVAVKR